MGLVKLMVATIRSDVHIGRSCYGMCVHACCCKFMSPLFASHARQDVHYNYSASIECMLCIQLDNFSFIMTIQSYQCKN